VMQDLPFPDGHFDFVWCRDVLEQVDDLEAALREMLRVLSSTGRMLVYTTFVTDRLTTEAEMMNRHLEMSRQSGRGERRACLRGSGLGIERKDVIGTEWREFLEERGGTVSRSLLRLSRLRRQRDAWQRFGPRHLRPCRGQSALGHVPVSRQAPADRVCPQRHV
jgi:SAM-dependent methyltransferase